MPLLLLALLLLTGCTSTGYASLDGAEVDAGDSRSLTVHGIHGACDTVREPEVEEAGGRVRVTVPLAVERGGCDDVGLLLEVGVRLDRPLGDRQVVDARTGRVLPVTGRDRCRPSREGLPEYLGLTEAEARTRHGAAPFRVTCRDGRELDRTSDHRPERLNVSVDDGRVTSASRG